MPTLLWFETTLAVIVDRQPAILRHGLIVLTRLITLGQVWIVVLLAVPFRVLRGISQCSAMPTFRPSSYALRFITGSAPGSPKQTGQTCVLGARRQTPCYIDKTVLSWSPVVHGLRVQ